MNGNVERSKGEGTEYKNYRGISLLSVVGKIYAGILVVCRVNGGLTDDEQGGFKAGRGCVDQIFTLKQIGKNARGKKRCVCVWVSYIWRRHMIGLIGKLCSKC